MVTMFVFASLQESLAVVQMRGSASRILTDVFRISALPSIIHYQRDAQEGSFSEVIMMTVSQFIQA